MWRNSRCGDILDVEKFWMWRNFTCGDILDVEKFVWFHELLALAYQVKLFDNIILMWDLFSMAFTLFSCEISFSAIYAVLSQNLFCRSLRTFCVETTYGQNVVRGEKWQISCMDMHQIMLISLFSTSFDHFHFHGFLKSKRTVILKSCHIQWPHSLYFHLSDVRHLNILSFNKKAMSLNLHIYQCRLPAKTYNWFSRSTHAYMSV